MSQIEKLVSKYNPVDDKNPNKVTLNTFLVQGLGQASQVKQDQNQQASQQHFEFKIDDENDVEMINKAVVHAEAVSDDEDDLEAKNISEKDPQTTQNEILIKEAESKPEREAPQDQ